MKSSIGWVAAGYGAVCTGIMLILNVLLIPVLPIYFNESQWTTGRQIFWSMMNVLLIALGNVLYTSFISGEAISITSYLSFLCYTLAIGLMPISLITLWHERKLYHQFGENPRDLQPQVDEAQLHFPSDNQGEEISIVAGDFLYARSADNYVEVYYQSSTRIERAIIRTTLKKLEDRFSDHPFLQRVHKSSFVNLHNVTRITGNAQGYMLWFDEVEEPVRVSRSFNLKQHLNGL